MLTGNIPPIALAALLYAGSGIGLSVLLFWRCIFSRQKPAFSLPKHDLPWLSGAILAGGIIAPILFVSGVSLISASTASLLLNLEGVCTALLAWFIFKENFDRRIFLGMALIITGGAILSVGESVVTEQPLLLGGLLIAGACLFWGIDNNLTRKISASDAMQIAAIKGLVSGAVSLTIAYVVHASFPPVQYIALAGIVGFIGYGLSLVLFVLSLRNLGTARTGAYFSTAPFVGAAISFFLLAESPDYFFWIALVLMAAGVWLHITEHHEHEHTHEEMTHEHEHMHDEHHQHMHDFPWDGTEPHTHPHKHEQLTHSHAHYPDIHHRHDH